MPIKCPNNYFKHRFFFFIFKLLMINDYTSLLPLNSFHPVT